MALRWTLRHERSKERLSQVKAYKSNFLPAAALAAHYEKETNNRALVQTAKAA